MIRVYPFKQLFVLPALAGALLFSGPAGAAGECPSVEKQTATIAGTFRQGIIVKEVGPGPFPGICENVISFQGRTDILYSDTTGRFFFAGRSVSIIDAESKANLTKARLGEFNRFTAEEMEKVASLTALSMGTKGPVVYFVTDPQ